MDNYNIPQQAVPDSFRNVPMPLPGEIAGISHETFMAANENDQMASGCEAAEVNEPGESSEYSGPSNNIVNY
jgi:hypothetical protein